MLVAGCQQQEMKIVQVDSRQGKHLLNAAAVVARFAIACLSMTVVLNRIAVVQLLLEC